MSIENEFLTEEELANDPDATNSEGIIICDKMWTICTVQGMWIYAEDKCVTCEGYNTTCEDYTPTVLE